MGRAFSANDLAVLEAGPGAVVSSDMAVLMMKGLLESRVAYMGGYPGAPVSGFYDVMDGANDSLLKPLGIHFDRSSNEGAAAAMMAASVDNPLRGALTWKVVGTNVAADALAHVT